MTWNKLLGQASLNYSGLFVIGQSSSSRFAFSGAKETAD